MSHLQAENIKFHNKIEITINGKSFTACAGQTVLSALVASGYKAFRKSRKTCEPRGPLCGMGVCYECLVTINDHPNQRACMMEVEDRMEVVTSET